MSKYYSIGYDIGSSSVKASLLDLESGRAIASDFFPKTEMDIIAPAIGWAEQDPNIWWENLILATQSVIKQCRSSNYEIISIGISYQMHGLVMLDSNQELIYPSIIWCDSRAVSSGESLLNHIGLEHCCRNYLNVPGNFTLSKLKWVKDNEPSIFSRIEKIMLPGDYIAFKLTEQITTTIPGLSEGIFWNFQKKSLSNELMEHCGFKQSLIPDLVETFGFQGKLKSSVAKVLGLPSGIPVTYRSGDQPNNAFSLNTLHLGEFAATAGTSGVIYGVSKEPIADQSLRVNTFAHVNYESSNPTYGILLCINGAGRLNSWLKNSVFRNDISYDRMNSLASQVPIGSGGINIHPFGNGAERMLNNINIGSNISGLDFNRHNKAHLIRAVQEGIGNAFRYGLEILNDLNLEPKIIRVGKNNLFLSPLFCEIFTNVCNTPLEIYNTDGSQGAARGAAFGTGFYASLNDTFKNLKIIKKYIPDDTLCEQYDHYYQCWREQLLHQLQK
ncbi:MAG: carbohydrate kinase [Candidatus Marinimicrobia bacterium]|nr:carbohydrate kinase [Candidatus Neomarinimicrobiota bacterium]|tara:strand:+ start:8077 stop:9576 length:1500 start_codon:yes stop_codon:yes gene_type:complete